ncbi:9665_t:CDS:1, partial [Dentiscutata erythropus]
CKHCPCNWACGKPQLLKHHLARKCPNVLQEIKDIWQNNLAVKKKSVKRQRRTKMLDNSNLE